MLKLSTDRKTANLASPNGKTPKIANAFGLPSGRDYSCPGQTSICEKVCYAGKLEKIYKGFANVMLENWNTITGMAHWERVIALGALIDGFEKECEKHGAEKYFRIHHDGDFYSRSYAASWASVIRNHPNVTFWVYTRSFDVVDILADIPNLNLYLSVDNDNIEAAKKIYADYPTVRLAYLAQTADEAKETLREMTGKVGAACPEVIKRIPLITEKGGACMTCRLCPDGKADIRFSISKK
jgi:Gene product 88